MSEILFLQKSLTIKRQLSSMQHLLAIIVQSILMKNLVFFLIKNKLFVKHLLKFLKFYYLKAETTIFKKPIVHGMLSGSHFTLLLGTAFPGVNCEKNADR